MPNMYKALCKVYIPTELPLCIVPLLVGFTIVLKYQVTHVAQYIGIEMSPVVLTLQDLRRVVQRHQVRPPGDHQAAHDGGVRMWSGTKGGLGTEMGREFLLTLFFFFISLFFFYSPDELHVHPHYCPENVSKFDHGTQQVPQEHPALCTVEHGISGSLRDFFFQFGALILKVQQCIIPLFKAEAFSEVH